MTCIWSLKYGLKRLQLLNHTGMSLMFFGRGCFTELDDSTQNRLPQTNLKWMSSLDLTSTPWSTAASKASQWTVTPRSTEQRVGLDNGVPVLKLYSLFLGKCLESMGHLPHRRLNHLFFPPQIQGRSISASFVEAVAINKTRTLWGDEVTFSLRKESRNAKTQLAQLEALQLWISFSRSQNHPPTVTRPIVHSHSHNLQNGNRPAPAPLVGMDT